MFYSHEVLTSRKYGVATVWLVATLGLKSNLKKVSRKAILSVDISKACDTILTPEAPMALRLQSNLLYGVTRVYSQQCGYVLTDVEAARNSLRSVLRVMRQDDLEPEGGNQGRFDQLVLPDDPNFLPDYHLLPVDIDTMDFDIPTVPTESQHLSLSPHSSRRVSLSHISLDALLIPPSQSSLFSTHTGGGTDLFGLRTESVVDMRMDPARTLEDDIGLTIDADGNMHFPDESYQQPQLPARGTNRAVGSAADTRHADTIHAMGDDGFLMAEEIISHPDPNVASPQQIEGIEVQVETSSQSAQAPLRRRNNPLPKIIPLDATTELHNTDLARWSAEYQATMRNASQAKRSSRLTAIAKKNAEHWVLSSLLGHGLRGPLDIFTGAKLLQAFTGVDLLPSGQKRRAESEDSDDDRRVRRRGEAPSDDVERNLENDNGMSMMMDATIEQGREAPTPLDERQLSSLFPWNQSAGSRHPTDTFHRSASYSAGHQPGFHHRRGSGLVSASPLLGHGLVPDADLEGGWQIPSFTDHGMSGMADEDDFETFGAAANVDTQTANQSQWQRAALLGESNNFHTFVQTAIGEADQARGQAEPGYEDDGRLVGCINFDKLLPPTSNSAIVAAQALMHVLTLGTKQMLHVLQNEAYGSITLRVIQV